MIKMDLFFRITLLEQLSRLPHAPSVPFQTTPSTIEVPEEVGTYLVISCIYFPSIIFFWFDFI